MEDKTTINGVQFSRIDSESFRVYYFPTDSHYTIDGPVWLHVSKKEGAQDAHIVIDSAGATHYIPRTWIAIRWMSSKEKLCLRHPARIVECLAFAA